MKVEKGFGYSLGSIGTTRPIPPNQRSCDGVVYRTVRCVQIEFRLCNQSIDGVKIFLIL